MAAEISGSRVVRLSVKKDMQVISKRIRMGLKANRPSGRVREGDKST
jgi:hypothetical protein